MVLCLQDSTSKYSNEWKKHERMETGNRRQKEHSDKEKLKDINNSPERLQYFPGSRSKHKVKKETRHRSRSKTKRHKERSRSRHRSRSRSRNYSRSRQKYHDSSGSRNIYRKKSNYRREYP